jgi:MerR family transcriptional regulator, mercuric resistance operon regulatory protein
VTSVEIDQRLSTAQLARAVDVPIDTIRYYERVGLLPEPPRTTGAHRRYPATAVDRLQFIRGAQRLGLRLAEIRDLLAVRDTGVCPCEPAELLLRRHLDEIDSEMRRLSRLRADLTGMIAHMPGPTCPDPEPGSWCPPVTS